MARESWEDLLELVSRATSRGIRVAIPGRVLQVNNAAGTVAVRLEFLRPRTDPELEPDTDPDLPDVPVYFPSSTAVDTSYQLDKGDTGLVIFADYALGVWRDAGERTDPGPGEPHGLSGAVFFPGLWPEGLQVPIPAEGLSVGMRGGERLEVVPGEVRVGTGATDRAIKDGYLDDESTFLSDETTFQAALSAWVAAVGAAFPAPTATFQAAITAYLGKIAAFDGTLAGHKTTVTRVK
jgi:hypothetical protein